MTDRLHALRVFVRVAHAGSLSTAGRTLGLSQPSVSRILAELERELGATLIVRSTRALALTDAGRDYLVRVEPLLAAMEEADQAARGDGELRGTLRIGVSSSFSVREVAPRLPAFLARHPKLRIEMSVTDARQDLVGEGVDLVFRLGALESSSLVARKIGQAPRLLAAAPRYLSDAPALRVPSDLAAHSLILGPGASWLEAWSFEGPSGPVSLRVESRVAIDSNETATAAAVAGLGVTVTSFWGCRAELGRGELVQVLPDWRMPAIDAHAVFPATTAPKASARAFANFIAEELSRSGRERPAPLLRAPTSQP